MESFEMQQVRKQVTWLRNHMCKNASLTIGETEIKNSGCQNIRRPGSAFCQDCSDKYKQK